VRQHLVSHWWVWLLIVVVVVVVNECAKVYWGSRELPHGLGRFGTMVP
jgi:hypothetical protein